MIRLKISEMDVHADRERERELRHKLREIQIQLKVIQAVKAIQWLESRGIRIEY